MIPSFWQLRTRRLAFSRPPLLMGIVNVTPDSFSDGGRYLNTASAVEHALRLAREGADLLDIGGESTRPGSEPVDAQTELERVAPVIRALAGQVEIPISIDTQKALVAREAIDAGAEIVNDVSALLADPQMIDVVATSGAGVCLMHMRGTPKTMQTAPRYDNVVDEVLAFLAQRRDAALAAGIAASRIAVDPGIGFGKTLEHNLAMLSQAHRLHELGCAVLVGHSRKRFIGQLLGDESADRLPGTIAVALALARQQVPILRVHDVAQVRQSLALYEAVAPHSDVDRDGFLGDT